ncbi:MAG: YggS family pyridoxal phosphate-dependent enzyme [Alphaproteobacteria bacterium]|jgi:pyridoxal phosphate enzyme (YggS family)|nr:YggS family pyridoxal phosphate-dependent enzyme [Alphaproteobacteria bacterium]
MTGADEVARNLAELRAALADAGGAGVTLVAAAKAQPDERLDAALAAGQRVFGENYVREAEAHWAERRAALPELELHLIGPLQTNKAKDAVRLFDVIESLDRERLAAALAKAEAATGLRRCYCVQVNTGEEPQKAGIPPTEAVAFVERARTVHGLDVVGLMAIPPADEPPGPHFALLAELADEAGVAWRSMGMSGDYLDAVRLGATHVRIGTGVFGARPPKT